MVTDALDHAADEFVIIRHNAVALPAADEVAQGATEILVAWKTEERPRIGLVTGLQAGGFIGLFLGFSLAVVSALTEPDALGRLVRLMCLTPVICALLLGPFLGFRRAHLAYLPCVGATQR